ncbi:hypothetical protein ELH42_29865 (plasmid) [Rhizobium ruizarguesonis]|uniref:hypothetical protein n=1 Tax=Rhizobium ruizarguesonis TaxID=2081791 RepID=UPI001030A7B6|nr:hypothetical protein [Rhizobium ruizarguesonis]TBB60046.1 hypothetical protein ELH42_29865 [Rhizobium ruizarguesonis]
MGVLLSVLQHLKDRHVDLATYSLTVDEEERVATFLRLHNLGLPAVATLSNDPKHIAGWLRVLSRRKIAVCDPGPSGALLAKHADVVLTFPGDQDLGAMSDAEVFSLLKAAQPSASN